MGRRIVQLLRHFDQKDLAHYGPVDGIEEK